MIIESQLPQDSLVTITVDKVGLITMISAAHKAIKQTNEWNLGDEYDTDITPFHDMKDTLIEQYNSVYGDDEWKSALAE